MLTTQSKIETVLRRELNTAESEILPHLDLEARFLIQGYTGVEYDDTSPLDIPAEVTTVAVRLVARALNADPTNEAVQSRQESSGPFSTSVTFTGGGAMYLGKADKQMLSRLRKGFTVLQLGNY